MVTPKHEDEPKPVLERRETGHSKARSAWHSVLGLLRVAGGQSAAVFIHDKSEDDEVMEEDIHLEIAPTPYNPRRWRFGPGRSDSDSLPLSPNGGSTASMANAESVDQGVAIARAAATMSDDAADDPDDLPTSSRSLSARNSASLPNENSQQLEEQVWEQRV